MWLNDEAATALAAYEEKYGVLTITSAGRTEAEQQRAIDRWDQGGVYNRPPYLYPPARPAATSPHVVNGGQAVDTPDFVKFRQHSEEFGFHWYGSGDPVHFNFRGYKGGAPANVSQLTRDRQTWLNHSRHAGLVVDGIEGPKTKAAYKAYQEFLKDFGYKGAIDGIWGNGTQAAHQKYYEWFNRPVSKPQSGVPSLRWQGIQEMLKRYYGYTGRIDGIAGTGTILSFQRFLAAHGYAPGHTDGLWGPNTAKAAQRWLKARWGYRGAIDGIFGPQTKAAWAVAEKANAAAF